MTHTVEPLTMGRAPRRQSLAWTAALVGGWFVVVLVAAGFGVFAAPPSEPPLALLAALAVPVGAFGAAMVLSPAARAFALGLDPALLTGLQAWRIVGGMFLVLYAFGLLPGLFAWPAGLGDVAVAAAAPFVAWTLWRTPAILSTTGFRSFHYLGIADLVLAIATGVAARSAIPDLVGPVTSTPMGQLPLVVIPAFAVPAFVILHIIALVQSSAARR